MQSATTVNVLSPEFLKSRGVPVNQGLHDWLNRTNFIAKTRQSEEERRRYTHWVLCIIEDAMESSGGIAGREWAKQPPTMAATAPVRVPKLLTSSFGPPIAAGMPAATPSQRPVGAAAPPSVRASGHQYAPQPPPFATSVASSALLRAKLVEECAQRCPAELRAYLPRAFEVMDASLESQQRTYEHVGFLQVLQLADSLRRRQPQQQHLQGAEALAKRPHPPPPPTHQPQPSSARGSQHPSAPHGAAQHPAADGVSASPTSSLAPPPPTHNINYISPTSYPSYASSFPSGSNHMVYSAPPRAGEPPPSSSAGGSHQYHPIHAGALAHPSPYAPTPVRGAVQQQPPPPQPELVKAVDDIARSKRPRESHHHHPSKGEALLVEYVSNSTTVLETKRFFLKLADASENSNLASKISTVVGSSTSLERKYTRDEPQPCDLRPLEVLKDAFRFVHKKAEVAGKKYLVDQLKGMRQDLSVQGIKNAFTVHVYETAARLCLEVEDLGDFNQCQAALRHLHRLTHASQASVEEFLRYRLAYLAFGGQSDALALELGNVSSECELAVCDMLPLCIAVQDFDALCVVHELQRTAVSAPCLTMLARLFLQRQRMLWLNELCTATKGNIGSVMLLKCLGYMPNLEVLEFPSGGGGSPPPWNDLCFVIDGSLEKVVASVDQLLELLKYPKPDTLNVERDIAAFVEAAVQAASAKVSNEEAPQQQTKHGKGGKKGGKKKAAAPKPAAPQPSTLKLTAPPATSVPSSAMFASSSLLAAVQAYLAFLRTRRDSQQASTTDD